MKRTKVSLNLNLDEITILGAALVHIIRCNRGTKTLETLYPNADIEYLLEQIAVARNEVEDAQ